MRPPLHIREFHKYSNGTKAAWVEKMAIRLLRQRSMTLEEYEKLLWKLCRAYSGNPDGTYRTVKVQGFRNGRIGLMNRGWGGVRPTFIPNHLNPDEALAFAEVALLGNKHYEWVAPFSYVDPLQEARTQAIPYTELDWRLTRCCFCDKWIGFEQARHRWLRAAFCNPWAGFAVCKKQICVKIQEQFRRAHYKIRDKADRSGQHGAYAMVYYIRRYYAKQNEARREEQREERRALTHGEDQRRLA